MPLVLNITVHSSLIEMRCKQMQHMINEGCVNHKSQLVQCSIHSPFTTVNSFVYFHMCHIVIIPVLFSAYLFWDDIQEIRYVKKVLSRTQKDSML